MKRIRLTYSTLILTFLIQLVWGGSATYAQNTQEQRKSAPRDSLVADSLARKNRQAAEELTAPVDTAQLALKTDSLQREISQPKKRFIPNSNRATWLAMVFPGAGQIITVNMGNSPLYMEAL